MHSVSHIATAIAVALPLLATAQETPTVPPPTDTATTTGTATPVTTVAAPTDAAPPTSATATTGTIDTTGTAGTTDTTGNTATTTTTVPPGSSATTTTTTTTTPTEPPPPPTLPTPPSTTDSGNSTNTNTNVGTNVNNNTNTSSSTSSSTNANTTTTTGTTSPPVIIPPAAGTGTTPAPATGSTNANSSQATSNVVVRNENVINNTFSVQLQNAIDQALREQSKQDYQRKVQQAQAAPQSSPPPALVYWTPGAPYWAVPHCTNIQHSTVASVMRHALDRDVGLIVASGRDACFYQPFKPGGICEWYIDLGCQRERLEREMQTTNPLAQ